MRVRVIIGVMWACSNGQFSWSRSGCRFYITHTQLLFWSMAGSPIALLRTCKRLGDLVLFWVGNFFSSIWILGFGIRFIINNSSSTWVVFTLQKPLLLCLLLLHPPIFAMNHKSHTLPSINLCPMYFRSVFDSSRNLHPIWIWKLDSIWFFHSR